MSTSVRAYGGTVDQADGDTIKGRRGSTLRYGRPTMGAVNFRDALARDRWLLRTVACGAIALAAIPVVTASPKPLAAQPFPRRRRVRRRVVPACARERLRDIRPRRLMRGHLGTLPGFSALLAPFSRWAGEYPKGAQRGAKMLVLASLLAVCLTAWRLGGPMSGVLAALMVGDLSVRLHHGDARDVRCRRGDVHGAPADASRQAGRARERGRRSARRRRPGRLASGVARDGGRARCRSIAKAACPGSRARGTPLCRSTARDTMGNLRSSP